MAKSDLEDRGPWPALMFHRDEIESVDEQILSLLTRRQEHAAAIGEIKQAAGLDVYDPAREKEVLDRLTGKEGEYLTPERIRNIFCEIISAARAVQGPLRIAYLGPESSFSHQAAEGLFGRSAALRPEETIRGVFESVERGRCHRGVVPVENSSEGSVAVTLDCLYQFDLKIGAESLLRIRHHILSRAGRIEEVRKIYSHPMAFAQTRGWLNEHLPGVPLEEVSSTSKAARIAAEEDGAAAVCSRFAADRFGLSLLEEDIEDHPGNLTRFLVIGKGAVEPTGADKTSLVLSLGHRPGSLHHALEPLAKRGVNMTRIESRPLKGRSWEYLFFVDLEGHEKEERLAGALGEMENRCAFLKRLGSYPAGGNPWD